MSPPDKLAVAAQASFRDLQLTQYESGTIALAHAGEPVAPVLPALRAVAAEIGVSLLNSAGGVRNTRQLGGEIIAALGAQRTGAQGSGVGQA